MSSRMFHFLYEIDFTICNFERKCYMPLAIKPASTLVQQKLAEVGRIELPVLGLDRLDNSTH
jgi:hypothetical protein